MKKNVLFLTVALLAALFFFSCASAPMPPAAATFDPAEWDGDTLVGTQYGFLEGRQDKNNIFSWLGIPYAAPPVGELRWQAPQKPSPWEGIRQATRFGSKSYQRSYVGPFIGGSEDSLYLNVWRSGSAQKNLPVYVWIHGGSNTTGSAFESKAYYGHALASKANLVFVSIHYRLDVLGWFSHPALKTGNPESDSGNFGTLDIIAALEWVRENISAFGGNPYNVTVAGESAGALNVLSLLIAPKARGLFHRAVVESGYSHGPAISPEAYAVNLGMRLALKQRKASTKEEAAALLASMSTSELASWLRSASPRELLALSKSEDRSILTMPCPIFDGHVLPADGFAALSDPTRRANVPLIIGTNKEETKLFLMLAMSPLDRDYQELVILSSLMWKAEGADSIADAYASGREYEDGSADGRVYVYRFDWGAPKEEEEDVMGSVASRRLGASHAMEIPFFLQTDSLFGSGFPLQIYTKANRKGRLALQATIGDYLAAFAWTGDPNAPLSRISTTGESEGQGYISARIPWESWNPETEKPAFLVLDAGLKELNIFVEQGRVRREDVIQRMANHPSPSIKEHFAALAPIFQ